MTCAVNTLLIPGASALLASAYLTYPSTYDEVLHAVHAPITDHGAPTKRRLILERWTFPLHHEDFQLMEVDETELRQRRQAVLAALQGNE